MRDGRSEKTTLAPREPALMDRPQRLWVLPTWSFWRNRENYRRAVPIVAPAVGLGVVALALVPGSALLHGVLGACVPILALGLVERVVRNEVLARRRRARDRATTR